MSTIVFHFPIVKWLSEETEDRSFAEEQESFPPPIEKVVLRHPGCDDTDCHACLNDMMRLQAFLDAETGMGRYDTLGMYRSWLDKNANRFGPAETEHGWFSPVVFEPEVIQEFVTLYQNDGEAEVTE